MSIKSLQLAPADVPQVDPGSLFVSNNSKTGFSINTAIAETCDPTEGCSKYCYGKFGRIWMVPARKRQYENVLRFKTLERSTPKNLEIEADRVAAKVSPSQDFLRMYGVGDLTPGAVRFINTLARRHPKLKIWISTRKVALAQRLVRTPNLHVMVSLDSTTPGDKFHETFNYVEARKPYAFAAYAQVSKDDVVPPWVKVIFAQHGPGGRRAPWTAGKCDKRLCPASKVNGPDHTKICKKCRYCFDEKRRDTGRATLRISRK